MCIFLDDDLLQSWTSCLTHHVRFSKKWISFNKLVRQAERQGDIYEGEHTEQTLDDMFSKIHINVYYKAFIDLETYYFKLEYAAKAYVRVILMWYPMRHVCS